MSCELIDHAARILERAPGRCMSAALLHARARRETGLDVPLARFTAMIAASPRFTILDGLVADADLSCWTAPERAAYAATLGAAGAGSALVLAAEPAEAEDGLGADACAPPADPFEDVHAALAALLPAADLSLRQAVGSAAAELHAVRRALGSRTGAGS